MHRWHFIPKSLKQWVLTADPRARESGQSIVILAIGLIALLGFAGLVFDGGTAVSQFRRMQNAADAGAMAGAAELARKDATTNAAVCAAINQYATGYNATIKYQYDQTPPKVKIQYIHVNPGNGKSELVEPPLQDPAQNISCETNNGKPPDNVRAVRATVMTSFDTWFLGLFGFKFANVVAHSSAEYANALPLKVQPVAKKCEVPGDPHCGLDFTSGTVQEIWQSTQTGNFGWLSWGGTNNADVLANELDKDYNYMNEYVDNFPGSNCKTLAWHCWVQGAPGVKSSGNPHDLESVRNALDEYIDNHEPIIIVLYDDETDQGGASSNYRIAGFAAFFIDPVMRYSLSGKEMWGTFDTWVTAGQVCKSCKDTGLYTVHLIPDVVEPVPDPTRKAQICVGVIDDLDADGALDLEETDLYVDEAHITVTGTATNASWSTTGVSVNCVSNLDAGSYTVSEQNTPPSAPVYLPNDSPGYPNTVNVAVAPGESRIVKFLDYASATGTIITQAFEDLNGNATQDGGDPYMANAYISLWDATNRQVGSGLTDASGTFVFRNRPTGSYNVQASRTGYRATTQNPVSINLTTAVTPTVKFGLQAVPAGDICVTVFDDINNNGSQESPAEGLISNAMITVRSPSNETWSWKTNGSEPHCFTGLPVLSSGQYAVSEVNASGYESLNGDSFSTNTAVGSPAYMVFRDRLPPSGTLCVQVFDDITGNGIFDAGEGPAVGAKVDIRDTSGVLKGTFTSDGNLNHCYNLSPASYNVVETNALGYYSTTADTLNSVAVNDRQTTTVQFGDRMATPTPVTPTKIPTKTPVPPTPTKTKTPTPGPSPTPTKTPIPGALCVTVFNDANANGLFDTTPPAPPPAPTPTVAFTPESFLAPKSVTVLNPSGGTAGTWDGSGGQPHCFNGLYPGAYTAVEVNQSAYNKSTTADSVTAPVQSSLSTSVLFGDQFCVPKTPGNVAVILQSGSYWLKWEDVGADSYLVRGSFTSQLADVPPSEWRDIKVVSVVDYQIVLSSDGIFFYVIAKNSCGSSAPSAVVALPSGAP